MGCQEMKEKKKTPIKRNESKNNGIKTKVESQKNISDSNDPQKTQPEPKIVDGLP
jgi:hypothetical protein